MKELSLSELEQVTGGEMKPTASGIIQSERNPGGGVTVDWNKQNQHINQPPTSGTFQFNGGDGSNGRGGWAIA